MLPEALRLAMPSLLQNEEGKTGLGVLHADEKEATSLRLDESKAVVNTLSPPDQTQSSLEPVSLDLTSPEEAVDPPKLNSSSPEEQPPVGDLVELNPSPETRVEVNTESSSSPETRIEVKNVSPTPELSAQDESASPELSAQNWSPSPEMKEFAKSKTIVLLLNDTKLNSLVNVVTSKIEGLRSKKGSKKEIREFVNRAYAELQKEELAMLENREISRALRVLATEAAIYELCRKL